MEGNKEHMNTMTLQELEQNIKSLIPDLQIASQPPAVYNPFKSYLTITQLDKIKMALLCLLVPIRLLLLMITILLGSAWATLFMIGYKDSDPVSGFRRVGQRGVYLMCHVVCFLCGFHNIKMKGKLSPDARIIAAVPHSSFMDLLFYYLMGRVTLVTKSENASIPLLGNIVRLLQPILVSRADKKSKVSVVQEIKRKVNNKNWPPTLIAVEGTCTNRKAYTFFKPGAFYPGLPVQPVIIRYPDCEDGALDYVTNSWIGPSGLQLVFMMLSRLHNRAEIEFLPLYSPSQKEIDDPFQYARNVRDYVAKIDDVPITDHSFEDCRLMDAAKKLNLPMETGLVEYYKISPMIDMNCDRILENLQKFAKINQSCDGVINIEEFCKYLNLPSIEEVKTIFRIYDINKDNLIHFREYLLGSFLISKPFNSEENISTAFSLLDSAEMGYITFQSFSNRCKSVMDVDDKYLHLMFDELDSGKNGKANYDQFKYFCLNKPEYALLFIHFRNLKQKTSSMTYPRAYLRRSSSVEEYESLSTIYI